MRNPMPSAPKRMAAAAAARAQNGNGTAFFAGREAAMAFHSPAEKTGAGSLCCDTLCRMSFNHCSLMTFVLDIP